MIEIYLETFYGVWDRQAVWQLESIAYLIGRHEQCDISLGFLDLGFRANLSKVHCCLFRRSKSAKDKYGKYLEVGYDLIDGYKGKPSSNGTYLNGSKERVSTKVNLKDKDMIYLSDRVRFIYSNPSVSPTSELEDTLIEP